MDKITLTKDELDRLIRDTVKTTLAEILRDADDIGVLIERLEDRQFGKMIQDGDRGDYVPEEDVLRELRR